MVAALVTGAHLLVGTSPDLIVTDDVVNRIVPNLESRFFHTIPIVTAGDLARSSVDLPAPRLIQDEDIVRSGRNLARFVESESKGSILPAEDTISFLGKSVDEVWSRIRIKLGTMNRPALIHMALTNHDAVEKERSQWRMTASAVLAVHQDRSSAVNAAVEREAERSRASTAARVMVEMALCTSLEHEGYEATLIDFDEIASDITLLIDLASASDAIHYGLYSGPLPIKPNMSLDLDEVVSHASRGGYLWATGRRAFADAAENYSAFFESVAPERVDLDPLFDAACVAEFGTTVSGLALIASSFARMTANDKAAVIRRSYSEVCRIVAHTLNVSTGLGKRVVDRLALKPRPIWDEKAPTGATMRDWYPWRFGRKLSLTRRPLVVLSNANDPDMFVSAGLFDRSLRHLTGAVDARVPAEFFDSVEMRTWIGTAINYAGHAFNHEVCAAFRELGWQALVEVPMSSFGAPKELGDVDVVAWKPSTGEVNIVECKRLTQARTIGEIGERLKEYTDIGSTGKARSAVRKHRDRVMFLSYNERAVADLTGLSTPITLRSCLVTESLGPMHFSLEAASLIDVIVDVGGLASLFR